MNFGDTNIPAQINEVLQCSIHNITATRAAHSQNLKRSRSPCGAEVQIDQHALRLVFAHAAHRDPPQEVAHARRHLVARHESLEEFGQRQMLADALTL